MGGLNLRSAHLHAPAAFISSLNQCNSLILDLPVAHSHMSSSIVPALALAAEMPEWLSIEDIDVPLVQKNLSHKIDEVSYNSLVASAPDLRSRALALSTAIPHAGDWLNVVPSQTLGLHLHDREFRLCLDYWLGIRIINMESRCLVRDWLIRLVTIMLGVEETEIGFTDMIPFVMFYFLHPNPQLLLLGRNYFNSGVK